MILIPIDDKKLLETAFTHRSYLNEDKTVFESNERLEFLGDAVLSLFISDSLYQNFPFFPEGKLTQIRSRFVCRESLAKIADFLNLGQRLRLSKGEELLGGRENEALLANTLEAAIGAVFVEKGWQKACEFLELIFKEKILAVEKNDIQQDPKSLFQEKAQEKKLGTPVYRTISSLGPDHEKNFKIGAYLGKKLMGIGIGKSKQKAEEEAARIALSKLL